LMVERAAAARGEHPDQPVARHGPAVGSVAAGWYECQTDCCLNLREPGRPALCQVAGWAVPVAPVFGRSDGGGPTAGEWQRSACEREFWTRDGVI